MLSEPSVVDYEFIIFLWFFFKYEILFFLINSCFLWFPHLENCPDCYLIFLFIYVAWLKSLFFPLYFAIISRSVYCFIKTKQGQQRYQTLKIENETRNCLVNFWKCIEMAHKPFQLFTIIPLNTTATSLFHS